MSDVDVDVLADPDLDAPVLLEGLPGVGLVGKLAVDHLIEELESEPVRRIRSDWFPPAVAVDDEGTGRIASLTLHAASVGDRDLLVLAGDVQAQESVGQYRVAKAVLEEAATFGVETAVGIGGYGVGQEVEEYRVVGATGPDSEGFKARLSAAGVTFGEDEGPDQIVGMSGLLVGLGDARGLETAGLLGITPGYYVDPASARAILEVLQGAFDFEVSVERLDEEAEQVQELLERLQQMQQEQQQEGGEEHLRYFG